MFLAFALVLLSSMNGCVGRFLYKIPDGKYRIWSTENSLSDHSENRGREENAIAQKRQFDEVGYGLVRKKNIDEVNFGLLKRKPDSNFRFKTNHGRQSNTDTSDNWISNPYPRINSYGLPSTKNEFGEKIPVSKEFLHLEKECYHEQNTDGLNISNRSSKDNLRTSRVFHKRPIESLGMGLIKRPDNTAQSYQKCSRMDTKEDKVQVSDVGRKRPSAHRRRK